MSASQQHRAIMHAPAQVKVVGYDDWLLPHDEMDVDEGAKPGLQSGKVTVPATTFAEHCVDDAPMDVLEVEEVEVGCRQFPLASGKRP